MSDGRKIITEAPPKTKNANKGWNELESLLQNMFHNNEHNHNTEAVINLHEYQMSEEEIKKILEEKKYNAKTAQGSNEEKYLKITLKD